MVGYASIGERPGLSAPDSLGVYLTWEPRVGRSDAERNCISNIRPEGLPTEAAAATLVYLLTQARARKMTGIMLKDETGRALLKPDERIWSRVRRSEPTISICGWMAISAGSGVSQTTRLRPSCLAKYKASSACLIQDSIGWLGTHSATPMLTVIMHLSVNAVCDTSTRRRSAWVMASDDLVSASSSTNSSPPVRNKAIELARPFLQQRHNAPQDVVADVVAEAVVDGFEIVEIDQQDRRRRPGAGTAFDGFAEQGFHLATVEGAGQRIGRRLVEQFARCRLVTTPLMIEMTTMLRPREIANLTAVPSSTNT